MRSRSMHPGRFVYLNTVSLGGSQRLPQLNPNDGLVPHLQVYGSDEGVTTKFRVAMAF